MKATEIKQMTDAELAAKLDELQKDYLNLRFGLTTQQLESPAKIKLVRRNIARIKTIMNEKKRAQ